MTSSERAHGLRPVAASRRTLLTRTAMLGGLGAAVAAGLFPGVAEACHTIPKSQGGCGPDTATGGSSGGSSQSSGSGKSSWTGAITSANYGTNPYTFFSAYTPSWYITKHFEAKSGSPRTALGGAPDGRPSIQMNIPSGINWNNQFQNAPFGSRGVDAAVASVDVYLASGFDWGTSEGKLALGLWGGEGDVSGGVPISQQKGFSIRNVRGNDKEGWGLRLYSYHLNRTSGNFGQVSSQRSGVLPKGRWFNIQLELHMNTPGQSNGFSKLRVDGKEVASMSGQVFRRDNSVGIRGLFWNDMWGGNEEEKKNWSPKNQKMWYSNYKLYSI